MAPGPIIIKSNRPPIIDKVWKNLSDDRESESKERQKLFAQDESGFAHVQKPAGNLLVLHDLGYVSTLNRPECRVDNVMNEIEAE